MEPISVQVPGKIMLAGEYAVLHGGNSLSLTIDRYLFANLTPHSSQDMVLESNLWQKPFVFRREEYIPMTQFTNFFSDTSYFAAKKYSLKKGFKLEINSDLKVEDGLGSSSALVLATLSLLQLYAKKLNSYSIKKEDQLSINHKPDWSLLHDAYTFQLRAQGFASGYDIVSQFFGGALLYKRKSRRWPPDINQLKTPNSHFRQLIHVFVGGKGAPTSQIGSQTLSFLKERGLMKRFIEISEELIQLFLCVLNDVNINKTTLLKNLFGKVQEHREILQESPHFPHAIHKLLSAQNEFNQKWTYKTTGAGGEDALIIIGQEEDINPAVKILTNCGWNKMLSKLIGKGLTLSI